MATNTKSKSVKTPTRGLGKGLSALMGETGYTPAEKTSSVVALKKVMPRENGIETLALTDIQPGKFQPRDHFDQSALMELAESIRKNGIVQPIIVREITNGAYEIIAGERRWRAATIVGLKSIPAIIRPMDDKTALEIALVENIQRADLNPLEEASGYQRLMMEFSYTQEALSGVVHKSRSHIANLLRLLDLPEEIRELLQENKLSMGHARALTGVENNIALARDVVEKGLSVRQTEKLVRITKAPSEYRLRKQQEKSLAPTLAVEPSPVLPSVATLPTAPQAATASKAHRDPDIMALEETLSENLGLKVSINDSGQSGEIMIAYESLEQLDDILRRLGGSI